MRVSDSETKFVDEAALDHAISELKAYINGVSTGNIDLSDYVTKAELQAKLDALNINIDLSSYVTKEELAQAINDIDLSSYALKEEIPSLDGYATTEYVDNAIANVPSGGTTDLSNYYTKDEVYSKSETDALIPTVTDGKDGTDGITPHIDSTTKHWMIGDTDTGIMAEGVNGIDGKDGTNGIDGKDGTDGVSPTVTVTKEGSVATITCTDVNGTTTATISDGKDGTSGGGSTGGSTDVYSTEETAIGTWIDGNTIYRKVVEVGKLSSVSNSNFDMVTTTFSDVACGEILRMTGILKYGTATRVVVDGGFSNVQISPSTNHSTYINNVEKSRLTLISSSTSVKLWYGADWGGYNYTLIVEYTKSA